ncbi:Acetyl-CoA acetyltransferase [bioreactor metagenome]|uniref:Acetyl-CoA acetyltransferase n=1 Tax=bioreactor metagenome TaxID=1076179 RepID=A0A644TM27_9ZZZZ|nr:thiolase family protein [Negativicutes bacterium]
MRKVVIASAVRTAGGKFGGSLKNVTAPDLGAAVIKEAVKRANIGDELVDQVIFGNAWQAGVGANPARIAAIKGGLPVTVPAFTVNIRCGSSLRALQLAALSVGAGETDIVVAGGTESASNVPYILPDARWGHRMGKKVVDDVLHRDGFLCPLADMFMGDTCELLNQKYNISRTEQDQFALNSQMKAIKAIASGVFKEEIVPIEIKSKKGVQVFDTDEVHKETSLEKLGKLAPVFTAGNTVTAGNSCALADAASAIVAMSEEKAAELGIQPLAVIRSYSFVGLDPKYMGLGPAFAVPAALKKAGMELKDIDLIELNEAFAGQVIACDKELKLDHDKLNIYGGAIALGHPVAATGTKILTTLLHAMKNLDKETGLATLCIGGGQGVAMIIERKS